MSSVSRPLFWEWSASDDQLRTTDALTSLVGTVGTRGAWQELVHPDDRARYTAAVEGAVTVRAPRWSVAFRLRGADGVYRDVEEHGFTVFGDDELVRLVGSFHDGDASPAPLGEVELRSLIEGLPLLAWATNPDGWLHFYNQRWYSYTGTTHEQMLGWGWVAVHDPYDLGRMLKVWRRALDTGEPWEDEFRLRRHDGELRWHLSRAMPVRDASGRITQWFGTNTDIHDQKLAAAEYSRLLASEQRLRREAEAASRAKDEFLAVVSHELRTPLHVILGWIEILQSPKLTPEKREDALAKIASNARLQAKLVEDMLDVSRIISGKLQLDRQPFRVGAIVRASVDEARPAAQAKRLSLVLDEDLDEEAAVFGDAARLKQVIGNLLSNALKFTPEGGTIKVSTRGAADRVEIDVTDTGVGFDSVLRAHLFDRFRQADSSSTRRHGGLGLGLAIVRELVERHGGEVEAHSAGKDRGARFVVRFPVSSSVAAIVPAIAEANDTPAISLVGVRVLVVDDNAHARELLSEVLLGCGASVTTAAGVHEALRAFKLDRPDVVVTDIGMPEIDGYSLVKRVRELPLEADRKVPIIALTAYAAPADQQRAEAAGFDRYLAKPASPSRLSRTIASLVAARP